MTVELDPKSSDKESFSMGVANQTFFDLVNTSELCEHIGRQRTNDPVDVDEKTALLFAEILRNWTPPAGWFSGIGEVEGKQMFIEFFETCGGFTTH